MIIRFFKFTKLPQLIVSSIISVATMINLKFNNLSWEDLYISFLLVFIFLLSIFIISKNSILKNNQYTTLGLIIFSGFFYKTEINFLTVLSYLFLLFSIRKIYSLKSNKKTNKKLFDAGFWFSISTILSPVNILFIISILFGTYILYKLNIKTILQFIVGYFSVLFIAALFFKLQLGSPNSLHLFDIVDSLILQLQPCFNCPDFSFFNTSILVITSLIFSVYLFQYFGSNRTERLKNTFLLLFLLNSILLIFLIEDYTIFLFFPFLVTLVRIISQTRKSIFLESVMILIVLLNSFPL